MFTVKARTMGQQCHQLLNFGNVQSLLSESLFRKVLKIRKTLKKLKIELPYDPTIPLWEYTPALPVSSLSAVPLPEVNCRPKISNRTFQK